MPIRRSFTFLVALAFATGLAGACETRARGLEAAVKAAFLPKFAPYVTWPAAAVPPPAAPYVICVVGRDPFGPLIEEALAGQRLGGAPMAARRLDQVDRTSGCHIAFVAGSSRQSVEDALKALRGSPVVTVTDARTSRDRGMIHFELRDGRVRFHVDDAAAARAGIGLSSKLLGLAISVKTRAR